MKIFQQPFKSKPFVIKDILAGDAKQKKGNEKIGFYQPKAEGISEKLEINISRYDELILAGAIPTASVDKLRRTIEPPPPELKTEAEAEPEAESTSETEATAEAEESAS